MKTIVKIFLTLIFVYLMFMLMSCGSYGGGQSYCHTYDSWTYKKNMHKPKPYIKNHRIRQ